MQWLGIIRKKSKCIFHYRCIFTIQWYNLLLIWSSSWLVQLFLHLLFSSELSFLFSLFFNILFFAKFLQSFDCRSNYHKKFDGYFKYDFSFFLQFSKRQDWSAVSLSSLCPRSHDLWKGAVGLTCLAMSQIRYNFTSFDTDYTHFHFTINIKITPQSQSHFAPIGTQ